MSDNLRDRLLGAFPQEFLNRLIERQHSLYLQSMDIAFNQQSWSETEAFNVLPYIRRALWESEVRQSAIECGLKCFDLDHEAENSSCVIVKAKGLILTTHYTEGPRQFVREAKSRKQNSAVNEFLLYAHNDENLLLAPLPKLGRHSIYFNLLHGAHFPTINSKDRMIDPTSCFLRVAIPDKDSTQYLYNWSAQELLQSYTTATHVAASLRKIEDKAQPVRKTSLAVKRSADINR